MGKGPEDARLRARALASNSSREVGARFEARGFRAPTDRHAASGGMRVAEEFLANSRLSPLDREGQASMNEYFDDPGVTMLAMAGTEAPSPYGEVALPPGRPLDLSLGATIARRRTLRQYTGASVGMDELAALVRSAAAITVAREVQLRCGQTVVQDARAAPSGGNLYPVELWMVARAVTGLEPGVYRYVPSRDALARAVAGDGASVAACFAVPDFVISIRRSAVLFLLVGNTSACVRKYGPKGVRLLFLEAGAMAEHLGLVATALGLGSVDCGAVFDDAVHRALGIDGTHETFLHSTVVGRVP